jgi:hypothetical protein
MGNRPEGLMRTAEEEEVKRRGRQRKTKREEK